MARRYDSRTTIFSPEGRLHQVEYAMSSTDNAGTVLGILAPAAAPSSEDKSAEDVTMEDAGTAGAESSKSTKRPGVVLIAEKRVKSKLLDKEVDGSWEKIFDVNDNIILGVAGITSDANSMVNYARNYAQDHLLNYNQNIPVERLVKRICDLKQGYTQFGGLRPFGVSFLYAGYDDQYKYQLYASDPSGNYSGWKATCIGANNNTAKSLIQQDYKEEMGLDEALELGAKGLMKSIDTTSLDPQAVEIATISFDETTQSPVGHIYTEAEITELLKKLEICKQDDDDTMKI